MTFDDLKELGSEEKVKRVGKVLQQGKKYVVNDGDIISFQHHRKT
jgi:ribosome-binding ATPase YchF (GTP1/OBG family)